MARQLAMASEAKTEIRSYVWAGRRHYALTQTHKLEFMRQAAEFSIQLRKVTGHCGRVSSLQNRRRNIKRPALVEDDDGRSLPRNCSG
jgi:hypothetical protein